MYLSCEVGTVIPAFQIRNGAMESMRRRSFPSNQQVAELGFNFSSTSGLALVPVTPCLNLVWLSSADTCSPTFLCSTKSF